MIHTYIPYAPKDKKLNLGWAYNNFMEMVNDEDWVLFLDHDATFTTRNWYDQIENIINNNPQYGAFSCLTNRIGQPIQRLGGVDPNNHDISYHRKIGSTLQGQNNTQVVEFPNNQLSGVVILTNKNTWKKIGGFKEGFLGVDNTFHKDCTDNNIKVGLMIGFYVYHWYRGDGDKSHVHESNTLHKNPFL